MLLIFLSRFYLWYYFWYSLHFAVFCCFPRPRMAPKRKIQKYHILSLLSKRCHYIQNALTVDLPFSLPVWKEQKKLKLNFSAVFGIWSVCWPHLGSTLRKTKTKNTAPGGYLRLIFSPTISVSIFAPQNAFPQPTGLTWVTGTTIFGDKPCAAHGLDNCVIRWSPGVRSQVTFPVRSCREGGGS